MRCIVRFVCLGSARGLGRRAVTALEFALLAPVMLTVMFAIFGIGLTAMFQVTLDNAVRSAARDIQIAAPAASSATSFVASVCDTFAILAKGCTTTLTYSVQAATQKAGFASIKPATIQANGTYKNAFFPTTPYGSDVNVVVQAAYVLPFTLPFIGSVFTNTGTNAIVAAASVRAEPF